MKACKRCSVEKLDNDFYANDKTCKECRKSLVRKNRAEKADYYREYDKKRFQEDPNVRARHRRYQATQAGAESARRSKQKWSEKNTIKKAASTMVGNAVRDGRLAKPGHCEACGKQPSRLHGHHDDYAYPLSVRWLCPTCHNAWHRENGEGANAT